MTLTRADVTTKIIEKKAADGFTWAEMADLLGQSKEWSTAALLGQACLTDEQAEKVAEKLD